MKAAKWLVAWIASNFAWTLVSGFAGALVSAILKDKGVFENPYGLVALGFLVAALFASAPAATKPLRRSRQRRAALTLGDALLPEHIGHRLIRLADLPAGLSPMGHTFEDCQIVGPAHVLFGECRIEKTAWIRPRLEIMPNTLTLPPGTTAFYKCRFLNCKFSSITAVGTEEEINALQAIFPPESAYEGHPN
jgi:hypothetical protein